jgi:acetolactate synthase-1/2/3 large subunit
VKRLIDEGRKAAFDARGKKLAAAKLAAVDQAKSDATIGWDASPITTARLCAEVYNQIKDEDWSLVGTSIGLSWPHRLWNFDKPYQWNGGRRRRLYTPGIARGRARQQAPWPADGGVRR